MFIYIKNCQLSVLAKGLLVYWLEKYLAWIEKGHILRLLNCNIIFKKIYN